jgi:hypothetical protein
MSLTENNIKSWVKTQVVHQARQAEKIFGLEDFADVMIISVDNRGLRARGGIKRLRPYIKISEKETRVRLRRNFTQHYEYGSFHYDKTIGNYDDGTVEGAVICLIAHELAHAIDYWTTLVESELKGRVDEKINITRYRGDRRTANNGGHGARWKAIYAFLRENIVHKKHDTVPVQETNKESLKKAARRRSYKKKVARTELRTVHLKKYRYYLEGDDDRRFTMVATKQTRMYWMTYLHDAVTNEKIELVRVSDGRKLRRIAEETIKKAYQQAKKKAA